MASPTPKPPTSAQPNDTTLDADIDPEIDMSIDPAPPDHENAEMEETAIPEPREATKKDISLKEFLGKMDDYAPIVCSQFPTSPITGSSPCPHYENSLLMLGFRRPLDS